VDVADGDESGVVNLLADHTQCTGERLPRRVNVRCFHQQGELGLERPCVHLGVRDRQTGAISGLRSSCHITELDENLWRDVQELAAAVQFHHGPRGNGVLYVGRVRQPHQDACINEVSHYS
jgi:hypothetical protein